MSSSTHPTSFITSISRAASTSTLAAASSSAPTTQQTTTPLPQAPTAAYTRSSDDGWSPTAIIGIVAAVVLLLVAVPLIAIILRRYERKRLRETPKDSVSSGFGSSSNSVGEGQSLRSILVTRELQRTSVKLAEGVDRPEPAYMHGREWSRTEVRGGDWK